MANRTQRFGFTTFDNEKDDLAAENYKAFGADRINLDRLLRIATEEHHHNGEQFTNTLPPPPSLDVALGGGSLPPNVEIFYRVSLVDPFGQEQLASQTASLVTPVQVAIPAAPRLTSQASGILPPGDYQYGISAYVAAVEGDNRHETPLSNTVNGSLRAGQGGWVIKFPALPSGATGFNVYRKGPTESGFNFLMSTNVWDLSVNDTGTVARDRARPSSSTNTTVTTNSVTVNHAATLTAGWTCKIYRTFDASNWNQSLIGWVSTMPFTDVGAQPGPGYPPDTSAGVGGAPKIRLTSETEGGLPPTHIAPMDTAVFNFRGPVVAGSGRWQWVNEHDQFRLVALRANLGVGAVVETDPIVVTVEIRRRYGEYWYRFVDSQRQAIQAVIQPGFSRSQTIPFAPFSDPTLDMEPGEALRVVVLQADSSPTAGNLSVVIQGVGRLTTYNGSLP